MRLNASVDDQYFGPSDYVKDGYKRRIKAIYVKCKPDKADDVNNMIENYQDDLHKLYVKVCRKYGVKQEKRIQEKIRVKPTVNTRKPSPRPAGRKPRTKSPSSLPKNRDPAKLSPQRQRSVEVDGNSDDLVVLNPDSLVAKLFDALPQAMKKHRRAFVKNGVEDDLLADIRDADLRELGVSLSMHRKCILKEIRKQRRQTKAQEDTGDSKELESWLQERNLSQLLEGLLSQGIRSPEVLHHCSQKDFDEMSDQLLLDLGLKLRFMKAVAESRQDMRIVDYSYASSMRSLSVQSHDYGDIPQMMSKPTDRTVHSQEAMSPIKPADSPDLKNSQEALAKSQEECEELKRTVAELEEKARLLELDVASRDDQVKMYQEKASNLEDVQKEAKSLLLEVTEKEAQLEEKRAELEKKTQELTDTQTQITGLKSMTERMKQQVETLLSSKDSESGDTVLQEEIERLRASHKDEQASAHAQISTLQAEVASLKAKMQAEKEQFEEALAAEKARHEQLEQAQPAEEPEPRPGLSPAEPRRSVGFAETSEVRYKSQSPDLPAQSQQTPEPKESGETVASTEEAPEPIPSPGSDTGMADDDFEDAEQDQKAFMNFMKRQKDKDAPKEMTAKQRKRLQRQKEREEEARRIAESERQAELARQRALEEAEAEEKRREEEAFRKQQEAEAKRVREEERLARLQGKETFTQKAVGEADLKFEYALPDVGFRIRGVFSQCGENPNNIVVCGGKMAIIVDVKSHQVVTKFKFAKQLNCVSITPNGALLCAAGKSDTTFVRDLKTGSLVAKMRGVLKSKTKELAIKEILCMTSSNQFLFVGGRCDYAMGFDLSDPSSTVPCKRFKHGADVTAMALFKNSLFTGGQRGRTLLFDLETQQRTRVFRGLDPIQTIQLLNNCNIMFCGCTNGQVLEFSVQSGSKLRMCEFGTDLEDLIVADGRSHLVAVTPESVKIMNLGTQEVEKDINVEERPTCATVASNGEYLCVCQQEAIRVYRIFGMSTSELIGTEHRI